VKRISQGLAEKEGMTEKDVDSDELAMGIETEMEHTDDPEKSKQTALDHLSEFPGYYSELKKMEDRLKKQKSAVYAYYRFLLKGNR
jgi:hypothetical protein